MATTFDYIIVGGGTAGCVLASRLSMSLPHVSILVIEAGPEHDPRIEPIFGYFAGQKSDIEWDHYTIPQKNLDGKVLSQWQGKILGGSSAINYRGWSRGSAVDFDQWAEKLGDPRWSWSGLLPYFKKSESIHRSHRMKGMDLSKDHGFNGPINVTFAEGTVDSSGPSKGMVEKVYESAGSQFNPDPHSGDTLGHWLSAQSSYEGKRQWAAAAYKFQNNVSTWTESLAETLIFERDRAVGVQVTKKPGSHHSERIEVTANREIIVSSGVQGSAKLLMLSGIGNREELNKHGLSHVKELPVGENYSDHPFFHTFWTVEGDGSWMSTAPEWMATHRHEEELRKLLDKGALTQREFDLLAVQGKAHTESFVMYGHLDLAMTGVENPGKPAMIAVSMLISPLSRGTVTLKSSDPRDPPILDPNVLSHPSDRRLLYAIGRLTTSAMNGPVGISYGAQEYGMEDEAMYGDISDKAMCARLIKTGETLNHGSGTCAMGTVVDTECRVKGIRGLRVVDASVFPAPIGAHYQAAVYALAEQMADILIKEDVK